MTTVSCQQHLKATYRYQSKNDVGVMNIRYLPASQCPATYVIIVATHPMLDPRSLPPPLAPAVMMKIHATKLIMSVPNRTSHSWNNRVIVGRPASGISSLIEWKIKGKTAGKQCDERESLWSKISDVRTWREVVSAIAADVVSLCAQLLLSAF